MAGRIKKVVVFMELSKQMSNFGALNSKAYGIPRQQIKEKSGLFNSEYCQLCLLVGMFDIKTTKPMRL